MLLETIEIATVRDWIERKRQYPLTIAEWDTFRASARRAHPIVIDWNPRPAVSRLSMLPVFDYLILAGLLPATVYSETIKYGRHHLNRNALLLRSLRILRSVKVTS